MTNNPLLDLPAATVALLVGDLRQRLMRYLARWGHTGLLLRYLDIWLAEQPQSVTLREGRARTLIECGRGDEALAILTVLDAERAATATRRQLRLQALVVARRFAEVEPLLAAALDDPDRAVYAWLLRGDLYRAQERFDAAADAYAQAQAMEPASPALARRQAELALALGDAEGARGYIDALMLRPDFTPTTQDLDLLLQAARLTGDAAAEATLTAQLASREQEERAALLSELGLRATRADAGEEPPAPAPPPARDLPAAAYQALRNDFGLAAFRPYQTQVIANVLAGRNTLAVMPTGAGKSLTYQLPALLLPQATVVVSPLIALMKDQLDGLPDAVRDLATTINSSLSGAEVAARLRGIAAGRYKLVYIAPERLRQLHFLHALKRSGVSLFVVDEAHCVSLWGLNFRPDYLFIGSALDELGRPPLLALTATASRETVAEIQAHLGATELVSASVFRPNLHFQVLRSGARAEKDEALVELCRRIDGAIIVYARARQACEDLAALLRQHGVDAGHYHAQVSDRAAAQERFMRGRTRVLVATVAFGMGIDKADIRAIIHYNLPQSIEAYYQEAGRAGRDGQPARCILLYSAADKSRMTAWLNEAAITRDQLRDLYRAVRGLIRAGNPSNGRFDIVAAEEVQRAVQADDETFLRVGLSMLERVGLLRRHFDLPRAATLLLRTADLPVEVRQVAELVPLRPGLSATVNLLDLAQAAGLAPSALEARLLEWADAGYLHYDGGGRDMLLELLPAPPDVADQIDRLLSDYRERQDRRVEAIGDYARSAQCRHVAIAAHFGQRLARCKTACDICAPEQRETVARAQPARRAAPAAPLPPRDDDDGRSDVQRLLDGLHNLPFPMGRSGLAKVLKGAATSAVEQDRCPEYAALRHLKLAAIEELIEQLVEEGYILRDDRDTYRRLTLSGLGRQARRDPSRLPEWAVATPVRS